MNVLMPQLLLAGGLPTGGATGATLLPGIQQTNDNAGTTDAAGFLAAMATLGIIPAVPSAVNNAGSLADGTASLFAPLANAVPAQSTAAETPVVPMQGLATPDNTADELAQLQNILSALFSDNLLPESNATPQMAGTLPDANANGVQTAITNLANAQALLSTDNTTVPTVGTGDTLGVLPAATAVPENKALPSATLYTNTTENSGEILLPASFLAGASGEAGIVSLPGALKISDLQSQQAFHDANATETVTNALLDGLASLTKTAPNANQPDEQGIQAATPTITANNIADSTDAEPVTLLPFGNVFVNRNDKKTENNLPQGTQIVAQVIQGNTSTSPTSTPDDEAISVVFGKPTRTHAFSFDTDKTGMLPGQTNPAPVTNGVGVQEAVVTATKSLGAEGVSTEKPSLQHATPIDQVTLHIAHAAKEDMRRITIHLEPASLGKVDIKMDLSHDGKTQVSILVDRPETLELLQKDAKQLQTALNDAGVKTDAGSLNFSMRGGSEQQGRFAHSQGFATYSNNQVIEKDDPLLSGMHAYTSRSQTAQGIDIRV